MKRGLIVVSLVAVIVALLGVGSAAFFTREDTARNVITTGGIDFEIHEVRKDGSTFPVEGIEILPGDTVDKKVTVQNVSDHPIYVRLKLSKRVSDSKLKADNCFTVNINDEKWTEGKDGYYYYNDPVAPKAETEPIFTEVYIDGRTVDNSYLGKAFFLDIDGNAVQSENNGKDVFSAVGWTENDKTE